MDLACGPIRAHSAARIADRKVQSEVICEEGDALIHHAGMLVGIVQGLLNDPRNAANDFTR